MHDLIIIGAGPAGLGSSIYASRYKLDHLVIGEEIGGQVVEAWEIENYAGFDSISGKDLMDRFRKQTEDLGGKILQESVRKVERKEKGFVVHCDSGTHESRTLIFALGMKPRKMNVKGEDAFLGKGVSYCATCDAMFFRGKDVVVIGGGDSAITAAIHLGEFAKNVYLLYRESLTCEPSWVDEANKQSKLKMVCCTDIKEIKGEKAVSSIIYEENSQEKELAVQGVFIEVGTVPGVAIAKELGVETDQQGYIVVDQAQATNVDGVWAAGDVTTGSNKFRQIITAVAEGAVAAGSVYKDLKITKK